MMSRVVSMAAVDPVLTRIRAPTIAAFGRLAGTSKTRHVSTGSIQAPWPRYWK